MEKKIREIYESLPHTHQDLAFFAHHLIVSLNTFKEVRVKLHYSENRKENGVLKNVFFMSVHQCQEIIIEELKRASEHTDEIEARYDDHVNIQRLQEFKDSVAISHKGLAIFVQELIKRFDELKKERLYQLGLKLLNEERIDRNSEKVFLEVINEVEKEIMIELEKTYEDIKNTGKPGYIKNYIDGVY